MPRTTKSKPDRNERRRNKRLLDRLKSSKPPRCPNRFILYRRDKQTKYFSDPNNPIDMRQLSKVIAKMWEDEPPAIKNYWDQVAEREKLNSSYRTSFDTIQGLDISMQSDENRTYVNATASDTHPRNSSINNISEDFIFEYESEPTTPPESSESFTNESSQPTSDDDVSSTVLDFSNLTLNVPFIEQTEPYRHLYIDSFDPMLTTEQPYFGEYSYFSDEQGSFDDLYTDSSPLTTDESEEREDYFLPALPEDELPFVSHY